MPFCMEASERPEVNVKGEVVIGENGINMSKRRSWAASSTVFFDFQVLRMHGIPLLGQYGCLHSPCWKSGGSF